MLNGKFFRVGFYSLLFLTGLCASLLAQEFGAGVFGGLTFSQVDGDTYGGYNKLGMNGGVCVNRELSGDLYWQMEIKYVSRGAYDYNEFRSPILYKTVYRYIELPLSVYYLFNRKYQPELGLSPDVLISYASYDDFGKIENDNAENRRFGFNAFAGFTYWILPKTGIGLRFTYSVLPFREPQEWNFAGYRAYRHNVFSLSVYQKFLPR